MGSLIKCNINEAIIEFLRRDLISNLNILGIVNNYPSADIYVDDINSPKGVLVRNGYFNYIYTKEESFIDDILNSLFKEGEFGFSAVEEEIARKIKSKYKIEWESPCDLYYLPKENYKKYNKESHGCNIDLKDAEIIDSIYTYRDEWSLDQIKENIIERPNSAIYVEDEIVSWLLLHGDNSMGIMYTKEEHRKKGYAEQVTLDLCHKIIEKGDIPFLHINESNTMSPGLAEKCGFVQHSKVVWFGIEVTEE